MSFESEARFFCRLLAERGLRPRRVLAVGCGGGDEPAHIAGATGATVIGVDLDVHAAAQRPGVQLVRADARALPFRDGAFDALYCYHVLEHVPGPASAVAEAARVLAGEGLAFVGTPNRTRLIGYLGGRATAGEKLRWNLADWGRRLTGRWSNEQGAHAGFTQRELAGLLAPVFARVESVSMIYYEDKYSGLKVTWRRLGAAAEFILPSVYFVAQQPRTQSKCVVITKQLKV